MDEQVLPCRVIVTLRPVPLCDNCDTDPAAVLVAVEFPMLGQTQTVGSYCKECADDYVPRWREQFPEAAAERVVCGHSNVVDTAMCRDCGAEFPHSGSL